jgi:hypothetical protein
LNQPNLFYTFKKFSWRSILILSYNTCLAIPSSVLALRSSNQKLCMNFIFLMCSTHLILINRTWTGKMKTTRANLNLFTSHESISCWCMLYQYWLALSQPSVQIFKLLFNRCNLVATKQITVQALRNGNMQLLWTYIW